MSSSKCPVFPEVAQPLWDTRLIIAQPNGIVPNDPQFIQDGEGGEKNVEQQRDDSKLPVQFPPVYMHANKQDDDGEQQRAGGEEQTSAVDLHWRGGVHERGLDEPRQAKAEHVEHVGAHDVGHGHVCFAWSEREKNEDAL